MKTFRKICISVLAAFFVLALGLNWYLLSSSDNLKGMYRVEAKRLTDDINETGSYDLSKYPHLTGVYSEDEDSIYLSDEPYVIVQAGGKLRRVEYRNDDRTSGILAVNAVLLLLLLLLIRLLVYIWKHIIKPFGKLDGVPEELAKGNLAVPIPEEKSRFFGKFTWGVNMLRESIEDSRRKEISMQKDKKLLLLSLSHDIKTPLSAIKLNAQALSKGIYNSEAKRIEAAESISKRVGEIESFVKEITKAASEDFMNFETVLGEEFLDNVIDRINARYSPQLSASGTEFLIDSHENCLLSCDPDRLAECLQNLMENAIKYGDGRQIEISFDRLDGCELITVSNTGCTLEEKELTQIFESFHRGSNTGSARGNGLGLFICKRLMALMNGEVYAEIKDDRFRITLVTRMA